MVALQGIDTVDQELLGLLRANARQSTAALARQLGLSRSTVKDRIERLEAHGIIRGYTIRDGSQQESGWIRAQVMVVADPKRNAAVIRQMQSIAQVWRISAVSGIYDFVVEVKTQTTSQLDVVLDRIGAIEGVEKTLSSILLSTKFER